MPLTITDPEGESTTVTGEDYRNEKVAEAGANLVSATKARREAEEAANVKASADYFSREKVYGPPDENGRMVAIYMVGDPIPEEEAIRQGIVAPPPVTKKPTRARTKKVVAPENK